MNRAYLLVLASLLCSVFALGCSSSKLDSWNDGASKDAIVRFVERTTGSTSPDYVKPAERIAVFDNDGTLWAEQPAYFQLLFTIDRVKALALQHPEWNNTEPFRSILAGDMKTALAGGDEAVLELIAATHAGMTTEEFQGVVREWVRTARHPRFNRPYTDCVYQPMLEMLDYLRDNGYKTFIVSGGGVEFMRVFAEEVYGIPPEQVVGSSAEVKFEMRDGTPVLAKQPKLDFLDDKAGKPVAINLHIGRRPIIAFGNSDGDLQMLQWTTAGSGPRLGVLIRHTDAQREWAYDRGSHIGTLDKALDEAPQRGWIVVDMYKDWNRVFPWNEPMRAARGGSASTHTPVEWAASFTWETILRTCVQ